MFVEKVEFENLASLRGHWAIDFTVPEYENGIFAITGSNGAGKSTIMDAICLALYGRTPRQNRFNASTNEIMTKGTSFCSSKVTFRTSKGRFTAQWTQKKTKKSTQNPFSSPVREFWSETDPTINFRKSGEVNEQIASFLGLTFEQFTQSAMLAQFQFEKFLTASTEERTKILETLTGTGYFKNIVELAQLTVNEKNLAIRTLEARLGEQKLLPEEEMAEFRKEFEQRNQDLEALRQEMVTLQEELARLRSWNALQERIRANHVAVESLNVEKERFAPCANRLEKARHALKIVPVETERQNLLRRATQLQSREQILTETLERLSGEQTLKKQEIEKKESVFTAQKSEFEKVQPILKKVRELDSQLKTLTEQNRRQKNDFEVVQIEKKKRAEKCNEMRQQLESAVEKLESLKLKLPPEEREIALMQAGSHPVLEEFPSLNESLAIHRAELENWKKLELEIIHAGTQRERQEAIFIETQTQFRAKTDGVKSAKENYEQLTKKLQEAQKLQILSGEQAVLEQQLLSDFQKLESSLKESSRSHLEAEEAEKRKLAYEEELKVVSEKIVLCGNELTDQTQRLESLKEKIQNLHHIQSYEEARQHLHDGESCPLCGSKTHPFATEAPENAAQDELEMKTLKEKNSELELLKKKLEETRLNLTAEVSAALSTWKAADQNQSRLETQRNEIWSEICSTFMGSCSGGFEKYCSDFGIQEEIPKDAEIFSLAEAVRSIWTQKTEERAASQEVLNALEKETHAAFETLESAQKQLEASEKEFHRQENQRCTMLKILEENEKKRARFNEELPRRDRSLVDSVRKYISPFPVFEDGTLNATPESRLDFWSAQILKLKERYDLQLKIRDGLEVNHHLELQKMASENAFLDVEKQESERFLVFQRTQNEIEALMAERTTLFQNDPESVEKTMVRTLEDARQKWEKCREEALTLHQLRENAQSELTRIREETEKNAQELHMKTTEFETLIQLESFADEEDFQAAKIPSPEREELEKQEKKLTARQSELDGAASQNRKELESFSKYVLPDCTPDEMNEKIQKTDQKSKENALGIGMIQQVFIEQERIRKVSGVLVDQISAATADASRWQKLAEILGKVGNSKYKTFTNFVQGVTFNNLLFYANTQLRMLNPRYQLRTAPEDPTRLQVLDSLHEPAERAPESLSGGETFILSLALALGLTKIASRNVEINSFFIDEGFGALASDSLENALAALKNYNQEARRSGQKLIGIISHVEAVRSEIETVIRLTPYPPHQFSKIMGPGVSGNSMKNK